MITRAFTKSMIEKEEETRRRLSYFHKMKELEELQAKRSTESSNVQSESDEPRSTASISPDESRDAFVTPGEELTREEVGLSVDTLQAGRAHASELIQEDSPTLGTSGFVMTRPEQFDESSPEPGSAVTSDTAETFFENEPQESPPDHRRDARHSEIPTTPAISRDEQMEHATPRRTVYSASSERDDSESIQIMLGDSPIMDRLRAMDSFADPPDSPNRLEQDIWRSQEQQSQLERISEKSTPQTANQAHESFSTAPSNRDDQPWSPESVSSLLSGHTTLDSESYNTINRVLDAYHDPNTMSPESMNEFQRRLLSQSPGLARAGGWDPSKVTQLYLQKYRKSPDLSAVPKPLNVRRSNEGSISFPADQRDATRREQESMVETEAGDSKTVGGHSPAPSLTVPSATMNLNRASLNNAEDWLNTSPSMVDWINRQAMDTPADEREESFRPPMPVGSNGLKDAQGRSILPDIPQSGLGILGPENVDPAHVQGVSEIYTSPPRKVDKTLPPSPTRKPVQPRTSSIGQARTLESAAITGSTESIETYGTPRNRTSEVDSSTTAVTESERPSLSSDAPTKASSISSDQLKKLTRRKHIIKELVDTESSFAQDMTVVVDIYKGTSNVVLSSAEDAKTLFGNAHDIVSFSTAFLDSLKTAARSVYVLPKSKRWRSKRDSSATTESTKSDDQSSIGGPDLNEEDKDRMTNIGAAFLENIAEMEKVYTEYLKNHDAANQKLQQLQKMSKVQVWLKECRAFAHDLTTAWDLDSLLVKPVQRVLKYPLLLKELVEVTPENHPDFVKLDTAARELVGVSKRINEAKKRADLVEQVTGAGKSKRKEEGRLGLPKAFGRRSEKLKQQVGLAENFQDREYDRIGDRFGSHFFQLQVVMRDVEMYVEDVSRWVNQFNETASAIDAYIDVYPTTYPDLESKWRKFRMVSREMQVTALPDHVSRILFTVS